MTDPTLAALASFPRLVADIASALSSTALRTRPESGAPDAFSVLEHAWHLADLEREGFGARIARILAEDEPALGDFDGGRIARERVYANLAVEPALAAFSETRAANVARLAALTDAERARAGIQEGVGRVRLGDIARRMLAHDRAHVRELLELLREVAPDHPSITALAERDAPHAHAA